MSLQFILWQSVFINSALPPPAFPTHLQCAKPRITSPPVCGGLPRPEGNVHEHRQVTARPVHYRWSASRTLPSTEWDVRWTCWMNECMSAWVNEWPCQAPVLSEGFSFSLRAFSVCATGLRVDGRRDCGSLSSIVALFIAGTGLTIQ